jgi:crossover junction endodeoxyribonuclease RusA
MTLSFTVFGVAQSKGNHSAYQGKGMKFPIITETNRNVASWQQLVAEAASHALQQRPITDQRLLCAGVRVSVAFYLPRPKKFQKRDVFVPHCTKPDVDRLCRAVIDALTQVVFEDDRQVTELFAWKFYAEIGAPARIDVMVEPVPRGDGLRMPPSPLPLFAEAGP